VKNSALEKIKRGIGLEDAEVRAYVEAKAQKRLARMQTYAKVDKLVSKVISEISETDSELAKKPTKKA
jgi:hypothetical protein